MKNIYFQTWSFGFDGRFNDHLFFKELGTAGKECIEIHLHYKKYQSGEVMEYGSGENKKIFFILEGKLKTSKKIGDNIFVKNLLSNDDIFGCTNPAHNYENEFAQMITDVETLWIFSRDFQQLLKSHHSIARSYTMAMQHTLSKFEKRFEEISFFDVPLRILNFIEEWARNDGIEDEGWILLPNIYSQEDIASFLFCSRQSVSYFFRKMKESNMLKYSRSIMKVKKGFGEILSETKDVDGAMKATFLHNPPGMPCR